MARAKRNKAKDPKKARKQGAEATARWRARFTSEELRLLYVQRTYGIEPEEYKALLEKQKGCCAICRKRRKLGVDHDHQTDAVRGLLCFRCNAAIGQLGDSPERLEAAARYLRAAPRLHLVQG